MRILGKSEHVGVTPKLPLLIGHQLDAFLVDPTIAA
jgi:hypothetical protein